MKAASVTGHAMKAASVTGHAMKDVFSPLIVKSFLHNTA